MPDYTFTFDPAASGLPYVVKDRAGITVDSGTLESDADSVELVVDLPWGTYVGKASAAASPYASTPAYFANGFIAAAGGGGQTAEYAVFSGTGTGVTDYAENNLTLVADTDPQDWWSVASNTLTFEKSGQFEVWFECGGEFTYGEPVTEPEIYYKATQVIPVGNASIRAGQVMPDGNSVNVPDPEILGARINGIGTTGIAAPGETVTVTGAAGCIEDPEGTADFAYRMMVVWLKSAPTFPEA